MKTLADLTLLATVLSLLPLIETLAAPDGDGALTATFQNTEAHSKETWASPVLILELEQQRQSGLRTQRLQPMLLQPETQAYGRVLEIHSLLDLRARYRAALSELAITGAALRVAQKNHHRLARLHDESIIATRDLVQAESQLAADQVRQEAARHRVREIQEEAEQRWGGLLFRQAVENDSPLLEGLLSRKQALVLIALPVNHSLPDDVTSAKIAPTSDRQIAQGAQLVSPAPRTDDTTQGETWFFSTEIGRLRTGMRLDAWIPRSGAATSGVILPLSAVVWHDGKPWVYLRTGERSFSRRPVSEHRDYGDAWFTSEGFTSDEEIVVSGAQMLLSEEFRRQIPRGGEDD